jgi:hypothetical protein
VFPTVEDMFSSSIVKKQENLNTQNCDCTLYFVKVSHAEGRTKIRKLQDSVLKTVMQPVRKELA